MKNSKEVSVIVVNFNGWHYLEECLSSILKNNFQDYEIIVVDNGSSDGSVEKLKKEFLPRLSEAEKKDKLKIVALKKNLGPARARNEGVLIAKGKLLGFLDNDTKVHPNWIREAQECFKKDKRIGAVQCKLLDFNKKRLDYVGEYLGSLGFLTSVCQYGEIDRGQYDVCRRILAAKSAGMFVRKDVFKKVGGFDEDYFIFLEETDLGWRIWLSGYEIVSCPKSVVYHYFSATKGIVDKKFNNFLIRFHGTKNYLLTLYKNLSFKYLIRILPVHIFLWFCLSFYLCLTGSLNSALNIGKGIFWNLINYKKSLKKRKLVQKRRVLSDERLFIELGLMERRSLFYFVQKFLQSQEQIVTPENQ